MDYISVAEIARIWGVSERSVRNYCATGRVKGACLEGKTWNVPKDAAKPERINKKSDESECFGIARYYCRINVGYVYSLWFPCDNY